MNASVFIIFACILLALVLGILARRGKDMSLEQWAVGGRGMGTIFIFILLAGEIFTTYTFLGSSGFAYGNGGAAFFGVGVLPYIIAYFLLPTIWKYAKKHKLLSQSDFFAKKYNSTALGVIVAVVGVVALIPYVVVQLQGLGNIVYEASYGLVSPTVAIVIGVVVTSIYVAISGIHGSAWTALVKDFLMLVVIVFMGIYLPIHYFHGIKSMFVDINTVKPGFLTLPSKGLSPSWYISTMILTSFGFYMWPHLFTASFAAKSEKALRRNIPISMLYALFGIFVLFIGFAAFLKVPGLTGANIDLSLFQIAKISFAPWFVGVIGAGGLLAAIVPGALMLMTAAMLLSKNIYKVMRPSTSDTQLGMLTRFLVPVVALVAMYFTLTGNSAIMTLYLMGYSLVTQLFPTLVFSLLKRNPITTAGAITGIVCGLATVAYITLSNSTIGSMFPFFPQWVKDLNVGIIALIVNIVVTTVVSLFTKKEVVVSEQVSI